MSNRVDNEQSNRQITSLLERRSREVSKKQGQQFAEKLESTKQQGALSKQSRISKEVLEKMAETENKSEAPEKEEEIAQTSQDAEAESDTGASNLVKQEKPQKTQKKSNLKSGKQEKQVEHKSQKVALDLAVQRKQQQSKDSGQFGGRSSQSDFFAQAANMGIQIQKTQAPEAHIVEIPTEILNQIVDQVYVGTNQAGESQFTIDLKEGVLNGARIQVSSKNKHVKLKFLGLDKKSQSALRESEQKLREGLSGRGLNLDKIEF